MGKRIAFLMLSLMALSACQKSDDPKPGFSSKKYFEGDLTSKVIELTEHKYAQPCDHQWKDRWLEMASAVQARKGQIEEFAARNTESGNRFVTVTPKYIGNYRYLDLKINAQFPSGWQTSTNGLEDLYTLFKKIENTPIDENWVDLNQSLRGRVSDDGWRIKGLWPNNLTPDSKPILESIIKKLNQCKSQNCDKSILSESEVNWLQGSRYFIGRVDDFGAQDRNEILEYVQEIYSFQFEPKVTGAVKLDDKTFVAEFNASAFGEESAQLKFSEIIEEFWQGNGYSLKVILKAADHVYKLVLDSLVGGRAHVSWAKKEMHLYPDETRKTIIHEFGHVLGLPDEYFTTWNPKTCRYVYYVDYNNVMSNHETGKVLFSHWDTLVKTYQK